MIIFVYCITWNIFIWSLFAWLIGAESWSAWWFLISFIMTTFPSDDMNDPDEEEPVDPPRKDWPGGPPLAGA